MGPVEEAQLIGAVDMLRRTGAEEVQIRFCDEGAPIVWMACAHWRGRWEVGAGLEPLRALFRLCEQIIDGGKCLHCNKPTVFLPPGDSVGLSPAFVCQWSWDAHSSGFRRSCWN
jgi:hypothetical protein